MFGLVGYIMAVFAVACILTVVVAMFRPIKQQDDWKAWKLIVGLMAGIGALPYGYVEILTKVKGEDLKPAIEDAKNEADVLGSIIYYKVLWASDKTTHVLAVFNDKNEFGLAERAIMEIDLVKGKNGWEADAYTMVSSFKRQRDATTMPPYW